MQTNSIAVLGVVFVVAASCAGPLYDRPGPMIPSPPPGFAYAPNVDGGRSIFPGRRKLTQRAYVAPGEPYSAIVITEFEGASSREDALRARGELERRFRMEEYGPLEDIEIDGRDGWAWLETSAYRGDVSSREYKAVIAYEDRTFTVEFHTSDPAYIDPAFLRSTVATFIVNRDRVIGGKQILALVALAALAWVGKRQIERARRNGGVA